MNTFEAIGGGFVRNGQEHRVLSGALHYFRVRPEQWRHRLKMVRAMGLNTVETYVPWNLHEPRPGEFAEFQQLPAFLRLAAEEGLDAIVRPGPYICAEWDNGGLPAWLTGQPGIRLRCMDERYLTAVDAWFDRLIPLIAGHQVTRGGNVIMVQVENEYGSYGSDQTYLRHLADGLLRRGIDVPLFTSDGPEDFMLTNGTIPGVLATVNFGSGAETAFEAFRRYREKDPLFCMEFWCGWFDHWGNEHITRDPADAADTLARILDAGASVNIYMAHGGTNFGTWAGANRGGPTHQGELKADVTSYDYDAPIDERGAPTEKFWLFREVLSRYNTPGEVPPLQPMLPRQTVELPESLRLFDTKGEPVHSAMPLTFEELGLDHGLVLYASRGGDVDGLADLVQVFPEGLLVESMGRVNYGPMLGERKGITGVRQGQIYVHGFEHYPFRVDDISGLPWGATGSEHGPIFTRGQFDVAEPADTFVEVPGKKGYLWVNGFLLGRYWSAGPQQALYLPWPLLKRGRNEIVVLELHGSVSRVSLEPLGDQAESDDHGDGDDDR